MCLDVHKPFFKLTFETPEGLLEEVSLKLLFILKKDFLRGNLVITLTSTIKNNFTLSYQNKNRYLKITLTYSNQTQSNIFKSNSFKRPSFKSNSPKN